MKQVIDVLSNIPITNYLRIQKHKLRNKLETETMYFTILL